MTDDFSLTLAFAGICTHFKGVVAGVPHRVVLPDCTRIGVGQVTIASDADPQPLLHYFAPHFPWIRLETAQRDLSVEGLLSDGYFLVPLRLQVVNPAPEANVMVYENTTPSLTDFAPDYNFASEVVLAGRASGYVDVFGGKVTTRLPTPNGASQVLITMKTIGPPELLLTPMGPMPPDRSLASQRLVLWKENDPKHVELTVANLENAVERPAEDAAFDYLLHFLTARGGIPPMIIARTPGMPDPPAPVPAATTETLGKALIKFGGLLLPTHTRADSPGGATKKNPRFDLTPSCSDSQYP